jgi:hypothetical protein
MATTVSNNVITTIGIDLGKNDPGTPNLLQWHLAQRTAMLSSGSDWHLAAPGIDRDRRACCLWCLGEADNLSR